MSNIVSKAAPIMAAAAAAATATFLIWIFSQQSSLGLVEWNPAWRRNIILVGAAGLVPLLLGAAILVLKPAGRLGSILDVATIAFSVLGLAVSGGLFGYAGGSAYSTRKPIPAVNLVNPAEGITSSTPGTLRLSLSSDPHWGAPTSNTDARYAILKSIASAAPRRDAFFILGDNVETGMNDDFWQAEARDLALLGAVPVRPILGNHDGVIGGEHHFEQYFMRPPLKTDSGSPFYYSIDAGPAKIIVLNLLWGAESFDAAQERWLEKTLSATPESQQVIVLSHCFFYASGYVPDDSGMPWYDHKGTIGKVSPILERHKVALVVSGHNHYMEYLEHGGVAYAIIGSMGGVLDPAPTYHSPASLWLGQGKFGRIDLDIDASGIALAFLDQNGATLYEAKIPRIQDN
jgi:Predicted phosphohydrolases